jgi:hypothetical protein
MANKRISQLTNTITSFRTGDVIPVDGPSGTAKMSKDDLLRVVRQGRASQENIKELESIIDRLKNGGFNYENDVAINSSGSIVASAGMGISDYVQVSDGDEIHFVSGTVSENTCLGIYDEQMNFVGYFRNLSTERTVTISNESAKFVRLSFAIASNQGQIDVNGETLWVQGKISSLTNETASELEIVELCLFGGKNYKENSRLDAGGNIIADNDWLISTYIETKQNDVLVWNIGKANGDASLCIYDENFNYLGRYIALNSARTITLSNELVRYIKASVYKPNASASVQVNGTVAWKPKNIKGLKERVYENETICNDSVVSRKNYTNEKYIDANGDEQTNSGWMVSDYIPVNNGDTLYWYYGSLDWDVCLALYNSEKKYLDKYRNNTSNYREVVLNTDGVAYVRASVRNNVKDICVKVNGDVVWVPHALPKLDDYKNEPSIIRIATYNVGGFEGRNMARGSSDVANAMRQAIAEANVTLLATQEDNPYFNNDLQTTSRDECFKNYKFYIRRGNSEYNYKGFVSDRDLELVRALSYANGTFSHFYFLAGERIINYKSVMFVCVHFDWADNDRRQLQIAQVIDFCANYENAIVMGDFNPENRINGVKQYTEGDWATMDMSDVDCALFTSAGYRLANNGYWGKIGTFDKVVRDGYPFPCDNIAVKGNVYIHRAGVIAKEYMDDHYIFYADISVG